MMRDVMPYTFKLRKGELMNYSEYSKDEALERIKAKHYKAYKQGLNNKIKLIMNDLRHKYNMPKKYNGKMFNYIKLLVKNFTNRKIRNSIKYDTVVEVEQEERREVKRLAKKNRNKRSHARRRYNKLINDVFTSQAAKFLDEKFESIEQAANDLNKEKVAKLKSEIEACKNLTTFERSIINKAEDKVNNSSVIKRNINGKIVVEEKKTKKKKKATNVALKSTIKPNLPQSNNKHSDEFNMLLTKKILDMTPEECESILKIKNEVEESFDDNAKMRFKMVEERYSFFVRCNYYKVKEAKKAKDEQIKKDKEFKQLAKELILENTETHEANIKLAKMLYPNNPQYQMEYLEVHDKVAADMLAKRNVEECFSQATNSKTQEREQSPDDAYYYNSDGECCYYDQQDENDD
jgi:hypothetical protein